MIMPGNKNPLIFTSKAKLYLYAVSGNLKVLDNSWSDRVLINNF